MEHYTDECAICGHTTTAHHISTLMTMTGIHGFMHTVHKLA